MNQSRPEPADDLTWMRPTVARRPAAPPAGGGDPDQPLGPFSVSSAHGVTPDDSVEEAPSASAAQQEPPAEQPLVESWLDEPSEPSEQPSAVSEGLGSEAAGEDAGMFWEREEPMEGLPWLDAPATDAVAALPAGNPADPAEGDPLAELDPIPDEWWNTEADALAETVPWVESGEAPDIGFAWEDSPEPLPEVAAAAPPEPLLDEELVGMGDWSEEEDSLVLEADREPEPQPQLQHAPAAAGAVPPVAAEPLPSPEFEEIAARLEQIARSLRSCRPADLLNCMNDPLQALIAGYALGTAERGRAGNAEHSETSERS